MWSKGAVGIRKTKDVNATFLAIKAEGFLINQLGKTNEATYLMSSQDFMQATKLE